MRFAEKDGKRILPNPLEKNAVCPICKSSVIAKCGKIKVWHWSHKSGEDCDSFSDGETEWHLNWKNEFTNDWQEVIMEKDNEKHRADIKTKDGLVIEFQNSSISIEDINEREKFYGKIKWVLNGGKFAQNLILKDKNGFKTFRWKWPPKTWLQSNRPIYIDMQPLVNEWIEFVNLPPKYIGSYEGKNIMCDRINHQDFLKKEIIKYSNKLFVIKKVYNSLPCGGWGKLISKQQFIEEVNNGYSGN